MYIRRLRRFLLDPLDPGDAARWSVARMEAPMALLAGLVFVVLLSGGTARLEGAYSPLGTFAESTPIEADDTASGEGVFVSVTGSLEASAPLGDGVLAPGPWVHLRRDVEVWVPGADGAAGSWSTSGAPGDPPGASELLEPGTRRFDADGASVGAWGYDPGTIKIPFRPLDPTDLDVVADRGAHEVRGAWLHLGSADEPRPGDRRVRYRAVGQGVMVTLLGMGRAGIVGPHEVERGGNAHRMVRGDRDAALIDVDLRTPEEQQSFRLFCAGSLALGWLLVVRGLGVMLSILPLVQRPVVFGAAAILGPTTAAGAILVGGGVL